MALFAIVGVRPKPELAQVVERDFEGKFFKVASNHWVVVGNGTAQSISDALGVRGGGLGSLLIYNIGGYYGYASTSLWEWMKDNGSET